MSLRPSGFWCDVCNNPMASEMLLNTPIKSFKLSCSKSEMHFHDNCLPLLEKSTSTEDETILPVDSPLGRLIKQVKEHNAKLESPTRDEGGGNGI